jgi:hypothetical protein
MTQVLATNFLDAVQDERERQLAQGKAEDNSDLFWYLIVQDQLALVTRQLSLLRYHGVTTSAEQLKFSKTDREAIRIGLVRLAACAMAWDESLGRERDVE